MIKQGRQPPQTSISKSFWVLQSTKILSKHKSVINFKTAILCNLMLSREAVVVGIVGIIYCRV